MVFDGGDLVNFRKLACLGRGSEGMSVHWRQGSTQIHRVVVDQQYGQREITIHLGGQVHLDHGRLLIFLYPLWLAFIVQSSDRIRASRHSYSSSRVILALFDLDTFCTSYRHRSLA